jgi:hypothetical protein
VDKKGATPKNIGQNWSAKSIQEKHHKNMDFEQ